MNKYLLTLAAICLHLNSLQAIFPTNSFTLGNSNKGKIYQDNRWKISFNAEHALDTNGYNSNGDKVNALQIWHSDQNALAMLRGFESTSNIGTLAATLNSANDDGTRGHVTPTADLDIEKFGFTANKKLPLDLKLNVYIPLFKIALKDIAWVDNTKNITLTDQLTKTKLTNNLASNVNSLGGGLNISDNWSKIGFGDTEVSLSWCKSFKQPKPILKNVELGLYGGLSLPTGRRKNEDLLMSIPFGNDGSLGIIFGGNISLQWWKHLRGGVNANFVELLGTTRSRRIKTDKDQTDLLLLAKADTRKEWGFTQQYSLFLEGYNFLNCISAKASYNYIKHNQDKLSVFDDSYSNEIANTALSLQEWTQHSLKFALAYKGKIDAQIYYKHPFNGKSVIQSNIFGGSIGISF